MEIIETKIFNPSDWEPCICAEEGEQAVCENCKKIIKAKSIGEHIYCEACKKYLWRLKNGRKLHADNI